MNPAFDLLITGAHLATMAGASPYGAIRDGAIGIVGETIAWVGAERDLPRDASRRIGSSMPTAPGRRRA